MPVVPLFGLGQLGKSPVVTAQSHLNLYAEVTPTGDKSQVSFYGTPGLTLFASFGDTPTRGAIPVGNLAYVVHRGTFYEVNPAGVATSRGSIGTVTGRVSMAYNGTQIGLVDGDSFWVYTIATHAFVEVTANVIGTPIDITFQDGYGVLGFADGKFQITASYDFTTLDALDYATAESNPDGMIRTLADHGELVLAGEKTTEFWGNSGGQDFPYSNQRGSTLEFGLVAPWSLVKFNDSLVGLFKNSMGQCQVMVMAGHALRKISSQDLDWTINSYAAVDDATGFAYMLGGHPMFQLNFPSAGKSWLFDASTELWSPLESGLNGERHRAEIMFEFAGQQLVTDYATGDIYAIDPDAYTDNGTPIAREIVGRHFFKDFNRVAVHKLQVDFETGVGVSNGQGADPQAMLQVSKDNGRTWGVEQWASMGSVGAYLTRVVWRRLGTAADWLFKIRITDPVRVVITSAAIDAEGRDS
jgi:hypothetical protein